MLHFLQASEEKRLRCSFAILPVIDRAIGYAYLFRKLLLSQAEALAEISDQHPGSHALLSARLCPLCHKGLHGILHPFRVETMRGLAMVPKVFSRCTHSPDPVKGKIFRAMNRITCGTRFA